MPQRSSERSGEVPLNGVGSLEELSEVEHDWISFLKWPRSNHGRSAHGLRLCAVEPRSGFRQGCCGGGQ